MTREVLLEGRLPMALTTERVEVRRIHILAGHPTGRHVHNGPVFGSIVKGSVLFQVEGEAEVILRPGDVFFEPAGVPVAHFDALDLASGRGCRVCRGLVSAPRVFPQRGR